MSKKRKTKEFYQEKFDSLYIPQDDELVTQCHDPYPPFWFVNNKGRLYSVAHNGLQIVKAYPTNEGQNKKLIWQYKYIDSNGKTRHAKQHQLVAEHFKEDEFSNDPRYDGIPREVHHINKTAHFAPDESEICNNADNLQILPRNVHKQATAYGNRTVEQDKERLDKLIKRDNPVHIHLQKGGLDLVLYYLVVNNLMGELYIKDDSGNTIVYTPTAAIVMVQDYLARKYPDLFKTDETNAKNN